MCRVIVCLLSCPGEVNSGNETQQRMVDCAQLNDRDTRNAVDIRSMAPRPLRGPPLPTRVVIPVGWHREIAPGPTDLAASASVKPVCNPWPCIHDPPLEWPAENANEQTPWRWHDISEMKATLRRNLIQYCHCAISSPVWWDTP